MAADSSHSFWADFRRFFVRGLGVLLPSVLTIWLVVQAYKFVKDRVAEPINQITRVVVIKTLPLIVTDATAHPEWYKVTDQEIQDEATRRRAEKLPDPENREIIVAELRMKGLTQWWQRREWLDAIGLILAIVLFYLAGRIFGGFIGRRVQNRIESTLARVPIFKQVYPYVKQLVDFMLGETKIEFKRVVFIEYPRKGIWSLGFATGAPPTPVQNLRPEELVTVFVPSSPTPFTGYTLTIARSEIIEADYTVEEALRFTVSGGVLVPRVHPAPPPRLPNAGQTDAGASPLPVDEI